MHPDEHNTRVLLMTWTACAYTIVTSEQLLRSQGKAVFSDAGGKLGECIGALVRHGAVSTRVFKPAVARKHCINLLSGQYIDRLLRLRINRNFVFVH